MEHDLSLMLPIADHINIIGSGGNINKIFRMASTKDTARQRMPINSVESVCKELKPLSVEDLSPATV